MKLSKSQIGDRRVVTRFAYFPTRLSNGMRVWLEKYDSREAYTSDIYGFIGWHVYARDEIKND